MLKKKIAAELSFTLIIIAILGLIALVVMMAIFGKETSKTVGTLETCESKGGSCVLAFISPCDNGRILYDIKCSSSYKICCVEI